MTFHHQGHRLPLSSKRWSCLKGSFDLFTESNQRAADRSTVTPLLCHDGLSQRCMVTKGGNTSRIKCQPTTWNQRRSHTEKHLLPFKGSCRGSEVFIMDVMESQPRSGSNHHSDTSPSRQRCSSEHRQCRKSCLPDNNVRQWRPKAMSQATVHR